MEDGLYVVLRGVNKTSGSQPERLYAIHANKTSESEQIPFSGIPTELALQFQQALHVYSLITLRLYLITPC